MARHTVVCVWTGSKYPASYVEKLGRAVLRHTTHDINLVCLTDNMLHVPGWHMVNVAEHRLDGWWSKMLVFLPELRDGWINPATYFDLDTVICGDIDPLLDLAGTVNFAICENFTRLAGNPRWPCRYGSCVMTFAPGFGGEIWDIFARNTFKKMVSAGKYGDQMVIESIMPDAPFLQSMLPPGFFMGYRDLPKHMDAAPPECSVVVFAGRNKPATCDLGWVRREWV